MGFLTGQSDRGEKYALEGYNYLKNSPIAQQYLQQGAQGNNVLLTGYAQPGAQANQGIANLLGIGGDPAAQQAAFKNYQDSTGYNFRLGEGMRAITGNQAASGLLNSGATLKRLNRFGQDIAAAEFQNYLGQLSGLSQSGLGAAGQLSQGGQNVLQSIGAAGTAGGANAGQHVGDSGSGLFGMLTRGLFSDERLKENITPIGTDRGGVQWYSFDWTDEAKSKFGLPEGRQKGVLAQDLEGTKYEKAVGERDGYKTVKYWMLARLRNAE